MTEKRSDSNMAKLAKTFVISQIGADGIGYITVMLREPRINENDLYDGGLFISFEMNFKRTRTEAWAYTFVNGGAHITSEKPLKRWTDETLSESECLKYAKELEDAAINDDKV